jgi:hypothetical protein
MGKGLGDLIAKLIIGAIGYAVADTVTKNYTGKHIHQHVFEWYRRAHYAITQWAQTQGNINAVRILAQIDHAVTGMYNKVHMELFGESRRQKTPILIYEETVPLAELRKQFGSRVRAGEVYDVTHAMLG